MNITRNQWIAIAVLVLSVNMGATAQLTDLFGPHIAKIVVSLSSLGSSILAGVQLILGGSAQLVKDAAALPGVEKITVNADANVALATVATSADQPKVGASSPEVREVLQQTAKGA